MIQCTRRLAAQIRLKVGHEQGGGDAFAGNVADDEAEAAPTQIEEVEIIATNLAGLQAQSGIFKGFGFGADLREQARLHLFGDFDFLSGAAFGLVFLSESTPLGFHAPGEFVEAGKTERVPVGIFETGVDSSPLGNVGRIEEVNAAGAPFGVFARYVFGDEPNDSLLVNQRLEVGPGFGERQSDVCVTVGGRDFNPASPVFEFVIYGNAESELIDVEPQAAFLIADVNNDEVKAQVGILPVEAKRGSVNAEREFGASHRRDYRASRAQDGRNVEFRSPEMTRVYPIAPNRRNGFPGLFPGRAVENSRPETPRPQESAAYTLPKPL